MTDTEGLEINVEELLNDRSRLQEVLAEYEQLKASEQVRPDSFNFSELSSALDTVDMGILVVDKDLRVELVNEPFKKIWKTTDADFSIGDSFRKLMDANRYTGIYNVKDEDWEDYVASRSEEVAGGHVESREFERADGVTLLYAVHPLSNDRRLLTYLDISDQRRRESELEEAKNAAARTKERLTDAIEGLEDGFVIYDKQDRLVTCNQAFKDQFGESAKHLIPGDTYREMTMKMAQSGIVPGIEGKEQEFVDSLVEKRHSEEGYTTTFQRHDGIWIRQRDKRTPSGDLVGVRTNITELKQASLLLEETTNAMVQGIAIFDKEILQFYNPMLLEILMLEEEQIKIGETFEQFLATLQKRGDYGDGDEGEERVRQNIEMMRSGEIHSLHRETKYGKSLRIDVIPHGEEKLILTYTDVTDIKEREKEAENASELLSRTINTMAQGLILFEDSKIIHFNSKANEILELPDKILFIGQDIQSFLDMQFENGYFGEREYAERFRANHLNALAAGKPYQLERKTKTGRDLRIDGVPTENGGLILTFSDITELKQREERLEQATLIAESAERAKSEFLANMSHEIRTPMNGVMGMAELLATTELDAKQKMFTDVIVKSGASLLTIINDILDFSKIDAGQMELDPAPFALAEAIEDVATLVSAKVAEKDLELIVRVDPALPKMMVGDVGRIRQIVTNLLGNAVKFTEKGHVYVNVDGQVVKNGDGEFTDLKFSVEDTGIGIPKDKCDQVFKKFSQVDTSATRKHEGTGLGLSIASSLVDLMGGEVGVESEVGQGSTFWFTARLPVHGETAPKQVIPGDMSGARILIVDDNEVNRSILSEQMTAWKFDSAATSTGAEGLEVMRAVLANGMDLDLVILDYQMPGMSGAEVLQEMRSDEALNDIPVVMLTSVDSSQTNQRLARLGAEANLTKPTRSSMLLETILQVVANKRADVKTRVQAAARPDAISGATPGTGSDAANNTPAAGSLQPDPNAPLDILVAEDNEVNQIVFRQILEETGLNFKIVENGRLAFASYKVQPPRMILMDVSMPEMNGKEATTAIRKYEREKEMTRTPIVGVTAHALKGDMEACIDAGMDDYLSKPVSPNKLILKVEQWLKLNLKQEAKA